MNLEEVRNSRQNVRQALDQADRNGESQAEIAFAGALLYVGDVIYNCFSTVPFGEQVQSDTTKLDDDDIENLEEAAEILDVLKRTAPGLDVTEVREQSHKAHELLRKVLDK